VSASPVRAVLDASVLVARWSRLALSAAAVPSARRFQPKWCEWIIAETWRVLAVRWLRQSPARIHDDATLTHAANAMLLALLPTMELVSVAPPFEAAWPELRDHYDRPVWAAALRAGASFVISHNLRDFPQRDRDGLCRYAGIEYVTAENFLREVLLLEPERLLPAGLPDARVQHQRRFPEPAGDIR
jgi:PIN domain-containing protein